MSLSAELRDRLSAHIEEGGSRAGGPVVGHRGRDPFKEHVPLPRVGTGGQGESVDSKVRIPDLRHAQASWLLAGGSDLGSVMDRRGHSLFQTTQRNPHALPDADLRETSTPSGASPVPRSSSGRPVGYG